MCSFCFYVSEIFFQNKRKDCMIKGLAAILKRKNFELSYILSLKSLYASGRKKDILNLVHICQKN